MAGGKGNIKPEDGKQFSSEYQPEEKWTEKKALEIGHGLIKWFDESETNVLFEEYLVIKMGLYPQLISYLTNKFTSFLKLIEKANKIQEVKLSKLGLNETHNATMTKFVLAAKHGYVEKKETKLDVKGSISSFFDEGFED